ncbi:mucin-21-like isoform X2 [Physella acuta]|uniref:mucin-21-like isoform X2 n=1 Tax=Physella acuta TaxID=109671 RepID=UPI0027DB56B1|nr:mucin-21-like isoform X2 [Physella acuta]
MASSSVSQESLDMEDLDNMARRNRIRVHRVHSGRGALPHRAPPDNLDGGDQESKSADHLNGEMGTGDGLGLSGHGHLPVDHESPTRGAAARLKEKRSRANHMKGKLPKDKRKLREKRRSTGVVHCMPSTESTGDSLDDEDDDEDSHGHDTKKNTTYNESSIGGRHHDNLYEGRHSSNPVYSHQRRNKSPSDLEADLEDNQDYDSTVSHSETNLSLIGRSESSEISQNLPGRQAGSVGGRLGGSTFNARYSPESNRALKFATSNVSSDADSSARTYTPSTSSSSSSILSRCRDPESPRSTTGASVGNNGTSTEPDSPRRINTATTFTPADANQNQPIQPKSGTFSVYRETNPPTTKSDKPPFSSYVASASRFKDREGGASGVGSIQSRLASYQSPRPFVSSTLNSSSSTQQQNDTIVQLEKQLEKERQDNKRLQLQLEEKDKKIAELEKAIELLNTKS